MTPPEHHCSDGVICVILKKTDNGGKCMNEQAINRLRKKFIAVAMVSFILVMIFMGGLVYLINLQSTSRESRMVLNRIIKYDGRLPVDEDSESSPSSYTKSEERKVSGTGGSGNSVSSSGVSVGEQDALSVSADSSSPEQHEMDDQNVIQYFQHVFYFGDYSDDAGARLTTRYFAVLYNSKDEVEQVTQNYIESLTASDEVAYAEKVRDRGSFGVYGDYYYKVAEREKGGTIVVFLDRSEQILTSGRILITVFILLALGCVLSFFLLRALSFKLVQPEIENAEKQKQFITNASHELKTPLAVIRANTEVEMMMNGENEWNQSTMRQVDHMTGLIQNLVAVTRAEEKEDIGDLQKIDASQVVADTCDTFAPVATQDGKTFSKNIAPDQQMYMSESMLRQLTGLLLDNAIKYCDEGGAVAVDFSVNRHVAHLSVSNNYAAGAKVDYRRFFERFYREDASHKIDNKKKGGFGVGLSIAQGIVKHFDGTINVGWKNGIITFTCTLREPVMKAVQEDIRNHNDMWQEYGTDDAKDDCGHKRSE